MRVVPRRLRRWMLPLLWLTASPLGGCVDDRGNPVGPDPGPLDGDGLFASAAVSAAIFRMHHHFAEATLDILESGSTLPVIEGACIGTGNATITDAGDSNPNTFSIAFHNYVMECGPGIPLVFNTDPQVGGAMLISFLETSPGLAFDVIHPFDFATSTPVGASAQLPADAGGFILALSTPGGALHYELEGPRGGGTMHVAGTFRLEDRAQPLVVVEELALEFAFDEDVDPAFADWPGGSYEIAGFEGGGGFGFGGATPSFPADVFFDGSGGAAFEVEGHSCVVNLTDLEHGNPCDF